MGRSAMPTGNAGDEVAENRIKRFSEYIKAAEEAAFFFIPPDCFRNPTPLSRGFLIPRSPLNKGRKVRCRGCPKDREDKFVGKSKLPSAPLRASRERENFGR